MKRHAHKCDVGQITIRIMIVTENGIMGTILLEQCCLCGMFFKTSPREFSGDRDVHHNNIRNSGIEPLINVEKKKNIWKRVKNVLLLCEFCA